MEHPIHRVTAFEIVAPFVLDVRFDDQTRQRIDFRPVLRGELYGPLRDATMFERVRIDPDARNLVWPNGADFDPATLHDWPDAGPRMAALAQSWAPEGAERRRPLPNGTRPSCWIIGIDCATEAKKTGLALAVADDRGPRLEKATVGGRPAAIVEKWLRESPVAALLALDAPLGWPRPLAGALTSHTAGAAIETLPDEMFRRETDKFVKRTLDKQPFDVGADKIARTAHAALHLLGTLRDRLGIALPLAWDPRDLIDHAAIEVYPAATLKAHGMRDTGYKKPGQTQARRKMVEDLRTKMIIPEDDDDVGDLSRNDDMLDAAVCVLAAWDFIEQRAFAPPNRRLAEREGWIWMAKPGKK